MSWRVPSQLPLRKALSPMHDPNETTVTKDLSVQYDVLANSIAVDQTSQLAVLGARRGLMIIDLDRPQQAVKTLSHPSKTDVGVVEWNPHNSWRNIIGSTANQNAFIWDSTNDSHPLLSTLSAHTRVITDLVWSPFEPATLATCSADYNIFLWDFRDPKKPVQHLHAWTSGATQVKFNRHSATILATAHEGEVRIWDTRQPTAPVTFITAHMSKISSLDWSFTDSQELVTCAQDKQIKFWNITSPRNCKGTMQSANPIWRARYVPFGAGIVTVAQRSDHCLRLWACVDTPSVLVPVHVFSGHEDTVKSFDFRIRGSDCQLVSWGKDQSLRLWRIDPQLVDFIHGSSMSDHAAFPISAASSSSSAVLPVLTLSQELEKARSIPNVLMEKVNSSNRSCTVTVTDSKKMMTVRLSVAFPTVYPHGAAPSFEVLETRIRSPHFADDTCLDTSAINRLRQALSETADIYVQKDAICLEACLLNLVMQLEELVQDQDDDDGSLLESDRVDSQSNQQQHQEHESVEMDIPCPPTTGVCWGPQGQLLCFSSMLSLHPRNTIASAASAGVGADPATHFMGQIRIYPRTFRDLLMVVDRVSEPAPENFGLFPKDAADEFESAFLSDRRELPLYGSPALQLPPINTSIRIVNLAPLFLADPGLGQSYTLWGKNTSMICQTNGLVSQLFGRRDLIRIWNICAAITESQTKSVSSPWALHPFGRNLAHQLLCYYERMHDLQTVAMLCCVFSSNPLSVPKQGPLKHVSSSSSIASLHTTGGVQTGGSQTGGVFPSFSDVIASSFGGSAHPFIAESRLLAEPTRPTRRQSTSNIALYDPSGPRPGYMSVGGRLRPFHGPVEPTPRLYPSIPHSSSANSLYTPTAQSSTGQPLYAVSDSEASDEPAAEEDSELEMTSLLHPNKLALYDQYRRVYADLLYRWGALNAHKEVLKYVKFKQAAGDREVQMAQPCFRCREPLVAGVCVRCNKYGFRCSFCHIAVKGLSIYCNSCGHGGHTDHIRQWFASEQLCPSGCGCHCAAENPQLQQNVILDLP
eukprot:GILK01009116.1.p1 GENE.GILK01009116.1~~GILK01009116.1.p1  ORF type:complete len:1037 (+),score=156.36 GILK01009116.1:75-3185(+)